jgi:hypothetical protein
MNTTPEAHTYYQTALRTAAHVVAKDPDVRLTVDQQVTMVRAITLALLDAYETGLAQGGSQ